MEERFYRVLVRKNDDRSTGSTYVPPWTATVHTKSSNRNPTDRVETKTQEDQRNKQRAAEAKQMFDADWKFWKESPASELSLTAANQRAKSILWIMLGAEGKRGYIQKLRTLRLPNWSSVNCGSSWTKSS